MLPTDGLDAHRIRDHFAFAETGRVVTNNAATTQPPRELVDLYASLVPEYENVHRGQSQSSKTTTERFEASFDTIAAWLNAPSRRTIALYRNATEAHNAVMYTMLTEVRDGDNVVTTLLEHNSNYVPWYALCKEILPRFGIHAECRLARFDHATGQLDLEHLAELVDSRTKIVCCTGASNFLGTRPPLSVVRQICRDSGYVQPDGRDGSLLLVDGAQLVPSSHVDVAALDVDYLSFSFHKFLAPFGIGVLYAKEHLLQESLPFLFGGDMIAEGQVTARPCRLQRPALEVLRRYTQHPRRDHLRGVLAARRRSHRRGRRTSPVQIRSPDRAADRPTDHDAAPPPRHSPHRLRHRADDKHPRTPDPRPPGCRGPCAPDRIQCAGLAPGGNRRVDRPLPGGGARRMSLRHAGAPGAGPRTPRQLPPQLRALQHR